MEREEGVIMSFGKFFSGFVVAYMQDLTDNLNDFEE